MKPQIPWLRVFVEGVVIVGSILLAFGIEAWWAEQQEREGERLVLGQLTVALGVDREALTSRFEIEREVAAEVRALLEHVEGDEAYSSASELDFGSVRRWVGVRTNSAPYEALKSRGFELILNESLRLQLIYYYENQFPALIDNYLNDRATVMDRVIPYFDTHFRSRDRPQSYVPLDYEVLRGDPHFSNLLVEKLVRLEGRVLPNYAATLQMIDDLLHAIEAELPR